ncbi:putative transposase [Rhodococcus wratislaviensis]|uniref:Transposase n=1 Tax=Rhodococcus wratislaviensis TaxID=44752 RepID=A0AB38FP36_RHOWR|nr:hypothetical protein [Rhodococcus wratislaviensis]SPZ43254.1 putative transposase [Rhodococcus wratislaviensis]
MTMVADTVDAVIGGDTPRHTRTGDDHTERRNFSDALVWIAEHAPGPRVVVGLEGTRRYGIDLARVLTGAGLTIVEVECPRRQTRRRGKSDPEIRRSLERYTARELFRTLNAAVAH